MFDGYKEKEIRGRKYNNIINGIRKADDLQIECMNCNSCLQWYGKYPDEITNEEFLKTYKKKSESLNTETPIE